MQHSVYVKMDVEARYKEDAWILVQCFTFDVDCSLTRYRPAWSGKYTEHTELDTDTELDLQLMDLFYHP